MTRRSSRFPRRVQTDLAGALAALTLLSPLMQLIALLIKLADRGPVFFTQERLGLNKPRELLRAIRLGRVAGLGLSFRYALQNGLGFRFCFERLRPSMQFAIATLLLSCGTPGNARRLRLSAPAARAANTPAAIRTSNATSARRLNGLNAGMTRLGTL
jgi:Bacterial sugar transferase